jgi:thioredoxin-related protein
MLRCLVVFAFAFIAVAQEPAHAKAEWFGDFDKAVAAAKAAKLDMLVDFTGSDWCGWCIKLHEEVFSKAAFEAAAPKKFILVSLDFPQGEEAKAKVPNPARNTELAQKYAVQGYPTILLMNAEGEVFAQTGYQQGGPEAYLKHLDVISTKGKEALAKVAPLTDALASAKPEGKAKAISAILDAMDGMDASSPARGKLLASAREALVIDKDNKLGLKLRVLKLILAGDGADAETLAAARGMDPDNKLGLFELAVAAQARGVQSEEMLKDAMKAIEALDATGPVKDVETAKQLYINAAFWNQRFLKDPVAAKKYAEKALPLVKDNERLAEALQELIDAK